MIIISPTESGITRSGYKSVRNKLLTRVDFPKPDSPTTINVNSKPFFTDFRCTWLGRFAKPTYPGCSMLENCKRFILVDGRVGDGLQSSVLGLCLVEWGYGVALTMSERTSVCKRDWLPNKAKERDGRAWFSFS